MRKKNLFKLIVTFQSLILTLSACAQQHQQNENRLKLINSIVNNTVLLNNQQAIIPITKLAEKKIASINLGFTYQIAFDSLLNKYADVKSINGIKYQDSATLNNLEEELKYFNTIIIGLSDQMTRNSQFLNFISNVAKQKNVILAVFGNGNSLSSFDNIDAPIIWSNQVNDEVAMIVPQLIFGGIAAQQTLTEQFSAKYTMGSGFKTTATRLKYTVPEDAGVNSDDLNEIDKIVKEGIAAKAAPGMVVLVAKDGKVIYNKAFGNHTYNDEMPDKVTDIFDLASVTKITATTPSVMRLVETNKLNLDTSIGYYIPRARTSPMNLINVREAMLHQAGFIPFIPFHNFVKEGDYSKDSSAFFPTKVADNYFIKKDFFKDIMWPKMLNSPIKTKGRYVYSDISMYVMQDIVEHVTQTPLNKYVLDNFYAPLGMHSTGYLPRNRFAKNQIVPTENDTYFRKTLLDGYVHDQGAALAGGVAGHAGLFGNANDLAIYYQMLLNKGTYGGEQYFKPQTVETFTGKQSNISRRGLGFDRWDPDTTKKYPSQLASPQTFGHTGYTGISAWVDPSRGLIYIFLSNRVNPTVSEQLGRLAIRPRIQDAINRAIDKIKK